VKDAGNVRIDRLLKGMVRASVSPHSFIMGKEIESSPKFACRPGSFCCFQPIGCDKKAPKQVLRSPTAANCQTEVSTPKLQLRRGGEYSDLADKCISPKKFIRLRIKKIFGKCGDGGNGREIWDQPCLKTRWCSARFKKIKR